MPSTVFEPARAVPVLDEAEVIVAGGGVAGCAAAWAATSAGARAILLERNGCLGGVATASLMANIGNRYLTATGEQVIRGFAGEVVERLVAVGGASAAWRHRDVPGCVIDSERLKVVLIEMLRERGVTVLTHCLAARPIMREDRVAGVFIEGKSGRQAIPAKAVVDATGEADLAWQAGAEARFLPATASTLFKLANVDLDRFVGFLRQDPQGFPAGMDWVKDLETFDRNWRERGILFFPHGGGRNWAFVKQAVARGDLEPRFGEAFSLDALGMYALRGTGFIVINSNFYRIEDLDVRNLSRFELHAQKMCYYVADFLRRSVPGFERSCVAHVGVDLGVRGSRFIVGRGVLRREALVNPDAPFLADDVIGTTAAQDLERRCGEFFKPFTADIPFGVTVPRGCHNLLVASAKSIHTEPRGLIRGMSGCMICGQAAGVACALAAKHGTDAADAPIRDVQREMLRQGVSLGDRRRLEQLGLA